MPGYLILTETQWDTEVNRCTYTVHRADTIAAFEEKMVVVPTDADGGNRAIMGSIVTLNVGSVTFFQCQESIEVIGSMLDRAMKAGTDRARFYSRNDQHAMSDPRF